MARFRETPAIAGDVRDSLAQAKMLAQGLGPELAGRVESLCAALARHEATLPGELTWAAVDLIAELNKWALTRLNEAGQLRTYLGLREAAARARSAGQ